jgi:non-heme chloroperoxidase
VPRITAGTENDAPIEIPYATYACVNTWLTDFRDDLPKIDVPTLVVHGTEDRILPFEATAARLGELIADATVVPVEGGPHNIGWTHPEEVNGALLGFLAGTTAAVESAA